MSIQTKFLSLLQEYLGHIKLRLEARTFIGYEHDLNLTTSRIEDLSYNSLDAYVRCRLNEGVTKRKINLEIGALKRFVRYCKARGKEIGDGILQYPLLHHIPEKERRALEPKEVRALKFASGRYWPFWLAILYTGMRRSEMVNLTWDRVDLRKKTLVVVDAKRKERRRVIPIHPELLSLLQKLYRNPHKKERVFYPPSNLLKAFKRCLKKAGIDPRGVDIHSLRVTFVTELASKGVSPKTVQTLAGHSNVKTTLQFYMKLRNGDTEKAVSKLLY